MTVEEFIAELKKFPEDYEIQVILTEMPPLDVSEEEMDLVSQRSVAAARESTSFAFALPHAWRSRRAPESRRPVPETMMTTPEGKYPPTVRPSTVAYEAGKEPGIITDSSTEVSRPNRNHGAYFVISKRQSG
jgi:hypothetical protein